MAINSELGQGRAQIQYRIAIELARPYNARMKKSFLVLLFLTESVVFVLGNGGAWQEGVPGSGSVSASDKGKGTNVAIESEALKIDLHPEYASVAVHYRMTVPAWNHGALLEVGLATDGRVSSTRLIPVVLQDGLPQIQSSSELTASVPEPYSRSFSSTGLPCSN